jgi:hypothetical protein
MVETRTAPIVVKTRRAVAVAIDYILCESEHVFIGTILFHLPAYQRDARRVRGNFASLLLKCKCRDKNKSVYTAAGRKP